MTAIERLRAQLLNGHTAAVVTTPHNRRYLTGFPSSAGMVLVTENGAWFMTDSRYAEAATRAVRTAQVVCYTRPYDTLNERLRAENITTLWVESEQSVALVRALREAVAPITVDDTDTLNNVLSAMRMVKTTKELDSIRRAQAITDAGYRFILSRIAVGRTERDIALDLEFEMRRLGAENVAFDCVVVSGANTSLPHGVPTDKPIAAGDVITMDFGAKVDGYCSDMTRTVAVGYIRDQMREVYDTVLHAQQSALAVIGPDVRCQAVDAAAREVIEAAGYGAYFGHGTGHGVGVEIHEAPNLSPASTTQILAVGNVVTVEPGIYLPQIGGVRIEDMVYITENGCENLTKSPKELQIL